jgi:hypothetical protein
MDGQDNSRADARYRVPELLNDAAAFRHFLRPNVRSGIYDFVAGVIRHEVTGAIIAVIVALGLVAAIAAFWPA